MILWQFLQIKFLTIFLPSITSEEWSLWYYRNSNKFCQYFLTSNGFVLKVFIRFKKYFLGCDWWLHFLMTGFLQTNYHFAFSYHGLLEKCSFSFFSSSHYFRPRHYVWKYSLQFDCFTMVILYAAATAFNVALKQI